VCSSVGWTRTQARSAALRELGVTQERGEQYHGPAEAMSTAQELYELNVLSSSELKLRGLGLLALGGEEEVFEACVLFHSAARLERKAVEFLSPCPPATRLAASIEECGCLLEGRDPHAAADVWARILSEADALPSAMVESKLSRLRPRYREDVRELDRLIQKHSALSGIGGTRVVVPTEASEQRRTLHAVREALVRFPGVPEFWFTAACLAAALGEMPYAGEALDRARRLDPENSRYRADGLLLGAAAAKVNEADRG
jgi:hypothetical protein